MAKIDDYSLAAEHREKNSPAFYRARATEARSIAKQLNSPKAREHMLAAAYSYDRLAQMAEKPTMIGPLAATAPSLDASSWESPKQRSNAVFGW